jgi:translation initiation factor IF-2
MWHVDHWKTSLLDYIREAKIADWEAGWITQSIWAYQVEINKWKITFLDTPWHEAFTIMRARWARSTDLAILVVAADEWVKPQTIESINHAKEAGISIIVAINKMDKVWANPDHVKWQLAEHWLTAEDWGWDIPMIPVSAQTGFWVDDLLEMIVMVSEMKELKANPYRNWIATVIESHVDKNLWPVCTVLINTWTIKLWDNIVCHNSMWKIKVLKDYVNHSVKSAWPWEPALIVWLDSVVNWGDILQVVNSSEIAKQKIDDFKLLQLKQDEELGSSLDQLMLKIKAWKLKRLKIILKADTNWSLEAIRGSLLKLSTNETTVDVIHAGVWSIRESDILMGQGSNALLVWYNVKVLSTARWVLEQSWVEYIDSEIIYQITERIEKIISWMLDPKEMNIRLWVANIQEIFYTGKGFYIVWLKLLNENKIEKNAQFNIIRDKKIIWKGVIDSLKSGTLDVKELEWPVECWVNIKTKSEILIWDNLSIFKIEYKK